MIFLFIEMKNMLKYKDSVLCYRDRSITVLENAITHQILNNQIETVVNEKYLNFFYGLCHVLYCFII